MTAAFIAGDWGLSHLRLWLCDGAGNILDSRQGPGISMATGGFARLLADLVADWPRCDVMLCGMVGSTLGWKTVPYVDAPATASQIAGGAVSFAFEARTVVIAPGVRSRSQFGAPDVMRGEETQIIGALECRPELRHLTQLFCLPGTHTKWVEVRDGCIGSITTAPTGELFKLLSEHSTLGEGAAGWDGVPNEAFREGLSRRPLLHALFEARSRRLADALAPQDVPAFLSGLLIGADVRIATQRPAVLVGTARLNALYAEALRAEGSDCLCCDGDSYARTGLAMLWRLTRRR